MVRPRRCTGPGRGGSYEKLRRRRLGERRQEDVSGTVEGLDGRERERGLPSQGEGASGRHARGWVCYYYHFSVSVYIYIFRC